MKVRNKKLVRQLKTAQSKLQQFQAKDDSVLELRRQVNDLLTNKKLNERADSRYDIMSLCFACQLQHQRIFIHARAKTLAKNFVQVVQEKEDEKERNKNLQRQLKTTQSKLQQFQSKDDSVLELRRQVNDLLANKKLNERADSRYDISPLCFACQH